MSEGYPRIITISVPSYVPESEIGDFATAKAVRALVEMGSAAYHHRSLALKPITSRLFALSFTQFQAYDQSKEVKERYAALAEAAPINAPIESVVPSDAQEVPAQRPNRKK